MKKEIRLILISLISIVILGSLYIRYKERMYRFDNKTQIQEKKIIDNLTEQVETNVIRKQPIQDKQLEELLARYIYSRYYRMYEKLAKEISHYLVYESKIPYLMIGLVEAESSFIVQQVSSVGAAGLGQIRYKFWKKEAKQFNINNKKELFDPIKNLRLSEYILLKFIKEEGSIEKALVRYHTGVKGGLVKIKNIKQRKRTKEYIKRILSVCGDVYLYVQLNNEKIN